MVVDYLVRQVFWNDAKAKLKWIDKRLPTEIEWDNLQNVWEWTQDWYRSYSEWNITFEPNLYEEFNIA